MTAQGPRNLTPSQAAARLGVSAKALRLYEEQGLIAPGRSVGGWRLYGPADLERAAWVVALRALGLSLAEVGRVMRGDQSALASGLAAHEERLAGQARHIAATLAKVRELRAGLERGEEAELGAVEAALAREGGIDVDFELPWPWAGEWFEMRALPRLGFITGPLGSGKTRFARRLAAELPDAAFLGPDRSGGAPAPEADANLGARVERAMAWLREEGAEPGEALRRLVGAIEAETPAILVVDMVEDGLCERTQRALMAFLRLRGGRKRALVLMTRSSAILDLDLAGADEAVFYCPANHDAPFRVDVQRGGRGFEAVATCLATPEARARTASITVVAAPPHQMASGRM